MGKGSGSCQERPTIALESLHSLSWQEERAELKNLLSTEINKKLGKNWLLKEQEAKAEERLGTEPDKTIRLAQNAEIKKQIQKLIVLKGPLHPDIKKLRKELGGGEIANPAWEQWADKRSELLGKKENIIPGQAVWRGSIDPLPIARKTVANVQLELEIWEIEQNTSQSAKKQNLASPQTHSKWVTTSLFGSKKLPEWITLEDGSVVFLGIADQVTETKHLGVSAKKLLKQKPEVCYRYWSVDNKGRLGAPLHGGSYWAPGINRADLAGLKWEKTSSQGLYAFKHQAKAICAKDYFDIHTGKKGETRVMITACLMWNVKTAWKTAVRAEYATPACVLALPGDSEAFVKKIDKVAEVYHMKKVSDPKDMHDVALQWFSDTLPDFFKS